MSPLAEKLPTILILAVLVGTFLSLRRHSPSVRTRLWIFAWGLIFAHFFVQIFETRKGFIEGIFESIDLAALEASGIVFVASLARSADNARKRGILLAALIPPAVFHASAATFNWQNWWALSGALVLFFASFAAFALFAHQKISRFNGILGASLVLIGAWVTFEQWHGDPNPGINAILTITFGLCGFLYWKRFPRFSPGVLIVSGGFLCWGAVFPAGSFMDYFYPHVQVSPELWNVPKFFVAFGMILSVLEEKSRMVEENSQREHAENALLQRFARITSRLLSGKEPSALCSEISQTISETTRFSNSAVILAREDGSLFLGGSSGSPRDVRALELAVSSWTPARIGELCGDAQQAGNHSFLLKASMGLLPDCEGASQIAVPLISLRGICLGWIILGARGAVAANSREIIQIEMIAADLAVTIENARLHHQLVRSEKLAAVGQLVAGVAHELNNPLTGIIGYSELLSDEVKAESAARKISKLGDEARRMHRIVTGLLRFARQSNSRERAANFETAWHDAAQLREFHLHRSKIELAAEIDPQIPPLAIGEDELKQILLNLLNNCIDALEDSREKIIRVHARREGDRVVFGFEDSGPGFLDLNRAFDPFYTTKSVGKGTGLGLSICYGIVRECGGDIHIANRKPYGASVLVELPAAHAAALVPVS